MFSIRSQSGFTLIEVVIYIALFTIIIGGGFVTAYQMIEEGGQLNTKVITQEEGNFVLRKINWALTSLDSTHPNPISTGGSGCNQTLRTHKIGFLTVDFRLNSGKIEMQENFGGYVPITTSNAPATCLKFRNIPAVGTGPSGITATTTINGIDFTVTKYLRK